MSSNGPAPDRPDRPSPRRAATYRVRLRRTVTGAAAIRSGLTIVVPFREMRGLPARFPGWEVSFQAIEDLE